MAVMKNLLLPSGLLFLLMLAGCSSSKEVAGPPDWLNKPQAGLDDMAFAAAVGTGATIDKAKERAVRELGYFFQTNIKTRSSQSTAYKETNSGAGTSSERTDRISEDIFITSANQLSYVTVAETYQQDGTWYARAILDKPAFGLYLTEIITRELDAYKSQFEQARSLPIAMLKFSAGADKKAARIRQLDQYLSVLNQSTGLSDLADLEKELNAFRQNVAFMVEIQFKDSTKVKKQNMTTGAFRDELKKTATELRFGENGNPQFYLMVQVRTQGEDFIRPDYFTRLSYEYYILDGNKTPLEKLSGTVKSAGLSEEESYRQAGVSLARQITARWK